MTLMTPILICLAVAACIGVLWFFVPEAALQAAVSVGVIAGLGIAGGIITMCSVVNDFAAVGQCHACRRSEEQSIAERHIGGNRTAVGFL